MLTAEIKINGAMIGHVYARNVCLAMNCDGLPGDRKHVCRYVYEYYEVESRKIVNGEVRHNRNDGIRKLISLILLDADKGDLDARAGKTADGSYVRRNPLHRRSSRKRHDSKAGR